MLKICLGEISLYNIKQTRCRPSKGRRCIPSGYRTPSTLSILIARPALPRRGHRRDSLSDLGKTFHNIWARSVARNKNKRPAGNQDAAVQHNAGKKFISLLCVYFRKVQEHEENMVKNVKFHIVEGNYVAKKEKNVKYSVCRKMEKRESCGWLL